MSLRLASSPVLRLLLLGLACLLSGCSTLTREPMQTVSIETVDANNRRVMDMRCTIVSGSIRYYGNSPLYDLQVRRSSSDLEIECWRGTQVARGTAVSRGSSVELAAKAVLPGAAAWMAIDHLSGYRYSYPAQIRLRVGEHLVFDANDDDKRGRPTRGLTADAAR